MLAIIAGTGLYKLGKRICDHKVETRHGKAEISEISLAGKRALFLPRHGRSHTIPPHMVNYHANIMALRELGATGVITLHAAGIISGYRPGDLILIDDFIGLFSPATFFDDFTEGMRHKDFTEPFSKELRDLITEVAKANRIKLREGGVIATTRGPRFETKAEVRFLGMCGANLLSMTSGYEMSLLGETEIDFASIAIGSNYAAGISDRPLDEEEVLAESAKAGGDLAALISGTLKEIL